METVQGEYLNFFLRPAKKKALQHLPLRLNGNPSVCLLKVAFELTALTINTEGSFVRL